ncbi:Coenzyme F420-reducing hydrogenase, alpha subunit [Blastochloris viridis]|uniref:Coenzyme F420-reducing hydrogenase, alpha subunit n=1 Tax=Blastochloris viridis TaxID=1079 RepID=A0A0S4Q351_BLAVI|nr:Coenzyme F420-reducing hydrogenase, alpha subunit [Blastochloris viridis]
MSSASVACDRPHRVGPMLTRQAPAEIPVIVGQLFALCSMSQSLAARAALAAAGAAVEPVDRAEAGARLIAERLVEHVRSTVLGFTDAVPLAASEATAARTAFAAGFRLTAGVGSDLADLAHSLDVLGLGTDVPPSTSWAGRVLAYAAAIEWRDDHTADFLSPDDDAAVVAALIDKGDAFAAEPRLAGRRPETGPYARARGRGLPAAGAGRLAARFAEIAAAVRRLRSPAEAAEPCLRAERLEAGVGFAAVESPRGRLHHVAMLNGHGAVARYVILAPTEWNFAVEGPFAAALRGLRLPAGRSVETLAALFDPCVACDVTVRHHAVGDDAYA